MAAKGKTGDFSFNAENSFVYVDGNREAPAYPGDLLNAWSTIYAYQRHQQIQDRPKVTLQYDLNKWFIRPTATAAYYGMMTYIRNPELATTPSGYQNYATRYDLNGGADIGYKFSSHMDVTLGYRYGSQGQEQYAFTPYSSPSDYQRVLAGIEGKPARWLTFQVLGGPDFRSFAPDTATHITPINDLHEVTYYGEALVTAAISKQDTATFKYKQFQFVSCLGKVPYFDSCYDFTYRHVFNKRLSLDGEAKLMGADYTVGDLAACQRNDLDYVLSAGLHYLFTPHIGADLGYQADLGRNALENVVNPNTRDFDRQLILVDVQFKL
jgi:hypothetical protein